MQGLNKVTLIGNVGHDPEMIKKNDLSIVKFSLATTEIWRDQNDEPQEHIEWHNIVAFGQLGYICQKYLSKGRQIYIEGRSQTRKWQDNNGNKRLNHSIIASKLIMLGRKPTDSN